MPWLRGQFTSTTSPRLQVGAHRAGTADDHLAGFAVDAQLEVRGVRAREACRKSPAGPAPVAHRPGTEPARGRSHDELGLGTRAEQEHDDDGGDRTRGAKADVAGGGGRAGGCARACVPPPIGQPASRFARQQIGEPVAPGQLGPAIGAPMDVWHVLAEVAEQVVALESIAGHSAPPFFSRQRRRSGSARATRTLSAPGQSPVIRLMSS